MKFNILFLFLSIIILASCENEKSEIACLPAPLQQGLIAYYPFNNGSLEDASSQNNDLTNTTTAAPAVDRDGNVTCAFGFNNTGTNNEFLATTQSAFLNNLASFSVSLWYQPNDPNREGGDYEVLVSRNSGSRCPDRHGEWSVGLYDCRRAVFGHDNSVWADFTTDSIDCHYETLLSEDIWHHITAVKNGSDILIYLNGIFQTQASGPADCGVGGTHLAQDIGDFFVGTNFTGSIDDILIYDRALTAQEISDLHILQACCE